MPRHTQRLYQLLDLSSLDAEVASRLAEAEEAIYMAADDPLVNWGVDDLTAWLVAAGLDVNAKTEDERDEMQLSPAMIAHWFGAGSADK